MKAQTNVVAKRMSSEREAVTGEVYASIPMSGRQLDGQRRIQ